MIKGKNVFLKAMVGVLICLFLMTVSSSARLVYNGAGGGYCDPATDPDCNGTTSTSSGSAAIIISNTSSMIECYIEEGAGYFLNAFSNILALSNRVEVSNISGIDYNELQSIVETGLTNVQNAKSTYYLLIMTAESTPYNPTVISKLKDFDYREYLIKNSLNSAVFEEVEAYLKKGDITGTFKRLYSSLSIMEGLLLSIKDKTGCRRMPDISKLWQLNETASNNLIFGGYVARVFAELSR